MSFRQAKNHTEAYNPLYKAPIRDIIERMARKKKRRRRRRRSIDLGLQQETLQSIVAIICAVLAFFLILAALDSAGIVGVYTYRGLIFLLGVGYFLLPILAVLLAISFFKMLHETLFGISRLLGAALFLLSGLGLVELAFAGQGGLVGTWITTPLIALFDTYVSGIVLVALLLISVFIMFNLTPSHLRSLFGKKESREDDEEEPVVYEPDEDRDDDEAYMTDEKEDVGEEEEEKKRGGLFSHKKEEDMFEVGALPAFSNVPYKKPPLSLLKKEKGKANAGDVKANANIIRRTLSNFGIDVEIEEVTIGPTITRYALTPAEGVRLSKIVSLQNNLELALAAHPIRIEAPIPGKSLVGIEVPNSAKSTVSLASLLESKEFRGANKPLAFPLGRIVSGAVYTSALSTMPHLLIAGATGAGKSVMIHTMITSLIYQNSPQYLKFIMIDPKRVELTLYKDIPHLLTPVITDAKKAVLALKWLTTEMERRYDLLEDHAVRDITSYHENVIGEADENDEHPPEALPYIVVVIDELADIMSSYPREFEASIVRLAQMSRAVGIHLVLSTQRPSVNVITGLIKANIPARIALQVASQVDSRTILDAAGAEKLLGAGDMLFISGDMSKPVRLQSGFISEKEVKKVSAYLRKHHDSPDEELSLTDDDISSALDSDSFDDDEDELYEDARETVIAAGKASTSYLQRKLRVGYARAARLMDMLEERGVVGPANGARPRDILIDTPSDEDNI